MHRISGHCRKMHPASCLFNVLLFVVTCLCSGVLCSAEELTDYRRPIKVQIRCCTEASTAKIHYPITEYKIQPRAASCVYAVIFRTEEHGSFCCDPNAKWVSRKVKEMSKGKVQLKRGRKGGKGGKKQKNKNNKEKRKAKQIKSLSEYSSMDSPLVFQLIQDPKNI